AAGGDYRTRPDRGRLDSRVRCTTGRFEPGICAISGCARALARDDQVIANHLDHYTRKGRPSFNLPSFSSGISPLIRAGSRSGRISREILNDSTSYAGPKSPGNT